MIPTRIGIDTSVLVRLVMGQPSDVYDHCVERLTELAVGGVRVVASNQVIGEAYAACRHHYGVPSTHAQSELLRTLTSGLVAPLNGQPVIEALAASGGPGLFDRLIVDDYSRAGIETLTLDGQMASLPNARRL